MNAEKYNQALRYEIFEKEEYGICKSAILEADVVLDIGGHLWFFSEWCRSIGFERKICLFEPVKRIAEDCARRLQKIWCEVMVSDYGIWAKDWEEILLFNEEKTMQTGKYESWLNRGGKEVKVRFQKIIPEDFRRWGCDWKKVFVKMDIEGMEYEVLASWNDDIWKMIDGIVIEIHFIREGEVERWEGLKCRLKSIFSVFFEKVNEYDERVRLVLCEK